MNQSADNYNKYYFDFKKTLQPSATLCGKKQYNRTPLKKNKSGALGNGWTY